MADDLVRQALRVSGETDAQIRAREAQARRAAERAARAEPTADADLMRRVRLH